MQRSGKVAILKHLFTLVHCLQWVQTFQYKGSSRRSGEIVIVID